MMVCLRYSNFTSKNFLTMQKSQHVSSRGSDLLWKKIIKRICDTRPRLTMICVLFCSNKKMAVETGYNQLSLSFSSVHSSVNSCILGLVIFRYRFLFLLWKKIQIITLIHCDLSVKYNFCSIMNQTERFILPEIFLLSKTYPTLLCAEIRTGELWIPLWKLSGSIICITAYLSTRYLNWP